MKRLSGKIKIGSEGSPLIITVLTLGVMLFLGTYFLTFALTGSRMSQSQEMAAKAYYLAEAGANQAIWKLKHEWQSQFETEPDWSASFTQNTDLLIPNSTLAVTIQNSGCARGKITVTSTINLPGGKTAQRVIKAGVFKAIGSEINGIAVFSGGKGKHDELKIEGSRININKGNIFSNNKVKIEKKSDVTVEGKILAVKELQEKQDSTTTATAKCADNICNTTSTCGCQDTEKFEKCVENKCPPKPIDMPKVDFKSKDENSYKNLALAAENAGNCKVFCKKEGQATTTCGTYGNKCVFDWLDFANLLWFEVGQGGTLTLNNDITYVKGSVWLRGGRTLIVNGVLVAERNIEIGKKYFWKWYNQKHGGDSQLIINNDNPTEKASGLLSKGKIEFGEYASFPAATTTGLLYASKEIKLRKIPTNLTIEGGIIAKKIKFENLQQNLNVSLNDAIIGNTLGNPEHSPIVSIEHWEESY